MLHRDWILDRFSAFRKYGKNYERACRFLEQTIPRQQQIGKRIDLRDQMEKLELFVLGLCMPTLGLRALISQASSAYFRQAPSGYHHFHTWRTYTIQRLCACTPWTSPHTSEITSLSRDANHATCLPLSEHAGQCTEQRASGHGPI